MSNVGRAIIKKLAVKFEGNEIMSVDDYDIFTCYRDLWKTDSEKKNAIRQGIISSDGCTINCIRLRVNAGDKNAGVAQDKAIAGAYGNKFIIPLDFMSSNIPSAPAYGVYASQLIRYARCCSNYSDFLLHQMALVTRLLSQGYKVNRLSNTFKKFYGRHTDLVGQYKKNVCQMFADSIS